MVAPSARTPVLTSTLLACLLLGGASMAASPGGLEDTVLGYLGWVLAHVVVVVPSVRL